MSTTLRIDVAGSIPVTAVLDGSSDASWRFVYAPGAGAGLSDGFGVFAAAALAEHGVSTLHFQFPYRELGRSAPDRPSVLEATWRAALEAARPGAERIVAGGRSMGGRIASQVAAQGTAVDALALFAYPLHPPGKPEQRRDAHLPAIGVPALFCSGDRDTFATVPELEALVSTLPAARLHVLSGADHGFNVLKSSGRTRSEVWQECIDELLRLIGAAV